MKKMVLKFKDMPRSAWEVSKIPGTKYFSRYFPGPEQRHAVYATQFNAFHGIHPAFYVRAKDFFTLCMPIFCDFNPRERHVWYKVVNLLTPAIVRERLGSVTIKCGDVTIPLKEGQVIADGKLIVAAEDWLPELSRDGKRRYSAIVYGSDGEI